jgi:hypothetical protein
MTIQDYIGRHGLIKRHVERFGHWIPSMLLPEREDDDVEFYANEDGTHVVVLNTTQNKFKIVHGDLLYLQSDWKDAGIKYETDAGPFWR